MPLDLTTDRLEKKPVVHGPVDSNVFSVIGVSRRALRRAGHADLAKRLGDELPQCKSYDEALALAQCYVEFDL